MRVADARERLGVIRLAPSDDAELRQLWRRVKKGEKWQRRGASGALLENTGPEQSVFKAPSGAPLTPCQ